MKCAKIHKKIGAYHQGILSPQEKNKFEEHLSVCKACSGIYTKFVRTMNHLNSQETIPEQPFYYTRLKQRMENRKAQNESLLHGQWARKVLQPAIYTASILLAVYFGILIGTGATGNESRLANYEPAAEDYLNAYAEYQYLNDLGIESIENVLISEEAKGEDEF
ncbi:MAG: zf-HC2 domain-containing protein [Bacteroidales bacterium]|jgi:predicted anti-sigma-YlaC factor YlaD|nr:zf-HC2 domain-containing protein [Bacteroidales bacterium]